MKKCSLGVVLLVLSFLTIRFIPIKAFDFCPQVFSVFSNQVVYADTDLSERDQEKIKEYYKLARQYYKEGNYGRTLTECQKIVEIDTYNINAHKLIKRTRERLKKEETKKIEEKKRAREKAEKEAQKQAKIKKKEETRKLARQQKTEEKARIAREKELAEKEELAEKAQIRLQKEREKALKEQYRKEERAEKEAQKQTEIKKKEDARNLEKKKEAIDKAKKEEAKELARQQKAQEQAILEAKRQAKRELKLKEVALKGQLRREEQIEEQAMKLKQRKLGALFDVAKGLYSEGRYDAAIAQCGEILKIDSDNRYAQKLIVKSQERIRIAKERELAEKKERAEQVRLETQKQAEKDSKLKEEAQIRLQKQKEKALKEQHRKEERAEKEAQKQAKLKKKEETKELAAQQKTEERARKKEVEELARQKEAEKKSAERTSKFAKQKAEENAEKETALMALQKKKIEERKQTEKEELENKIETHYRDGKRLYRNDEYSDAIKEFNAVLSVDFAHEGAKEYLKASEESLKEQNERKSARQAKVAKKQIARKERLRKRDIQDRITDAKIEADAGEYDEAIKILEEILPDVLDENLRRSVEFLVSKARAEKTAKEEKLTRKRLQSISDERMLEVTKAQLPPAEVRRIKELERKKKKIGAAIELKDKASSIKVPLVKYSGADLRDVVLFLIKQTGINIVVDEAMFSGEASAPAAPAAEQAEGWGGEAAAPATAQPTGPVNTKVTCFLQNMTLLSVLEAILRPKGLDYKFTKEYIYVSTKARILAQPLEDLETRVYSLEYGASMNIVRLGDSGFKTTTEDMGTGLGTAGEAAEGEASGVSGESIKELLIALVPQPTGASITVQSELNKLFVKNTPENLDKTEKVLAELRSPVQVSIEARYVYVRLVEGEEIGVGFTSLATSWQIGKAGDSTSIAGGAGKGKGITHTMSGSLVSGITSLGSTGAALTYAATLNRIQFTSVLRALQSRTDTNTLSAPKLTVLNNKPGIAKFVTTISYVDTVTSSSTTTDSVTTTNYDYTFTDKDVGMILNVTPQVNEATNCVTLFLQPVVSNVDSWTNYTISAVGTTNTTVARPDFYSKDIETYVTVHDGDTVVLGGFMEDVAGKTVYKVPFLSDIPLLGKLFQTKAKSGDKKKLLIFVTVNILDASGSSRATP